MNKTKIEWCDYTWNPVTGCKHGCPYCYAARISKRFTGDFEPKFHAGRLMEPQTVKKPSRIFTVSMGDLFGEWVPDHWIQQVFEACNKAPQHTYIFLTKNPAGMLPYEFPENAWAGVSATGDQDFHSRVDTLMFVGAPVRFVSLEPLLHDALENGDFAELDWVIVGAQTGPGAVKPKPEWVKKIIYEAADEDIPLFLKDNLKLVWDGEIIQEFPNGMR